MDGARIRETFLAFFEERGHARVRSSSLIPPPESGLLLANAGMNQFIPYFLGQAEPPFPRATSVQKCFRANDIENVGHTDRHLTMFEMLGNFSFGDYFKAESCAWGLELVTEGYGIDLDRLWTTVYETDDETIDIWQDLGIPPERIVRRGKADNYWFVSAGPAGPCSEIFVDRGAEHGAEGGPEVDEDRYMEIWNHVFMQEQVDEHAEVVGELPKKNIDTGASIERIAVALQGTGSFFETDLFAPLLEAVESMSGKHYGADERNDIAIRVIGEHARATAFLVADGVQASNEGRGYILRRMVRRVVSRARQLGVQGEVLRPLVDVVVEGFGEAYPELVENRAFVEQVLGSEEERFSATLRQGMVLFDEARGRAQGREVSGADAFKLSDTFGFPIELTVELAADAGLAVDEQGFRELLEEQRSRARAAAKKVALGLDAGAVPPSEFLGYTQPEAESPIRLLLDAEHGELDAAQEGDEVALFLDRTPFYAESGGQVGDHGEIRTHTGTVRVHDAQWAGPSSIMHVGTVTSGEIRAGQDAIAEIDRQRREATARSHTSTHVVHWTLKHILGEHARQAGSLVAPGRLRFDFPNPGAVSNDVLEQAELEANRLLARDDAPHIFETSMDEAKALGATMLFDEKYGDVVRVVEIGDYSRELCGGTHVERTGRIGVLRILHEGSIGSGMRRVEALVGPDALREINAERELLRGLVEALGSKDAAAALDHARRVVEENKRLRNELGRLSQQQAAGRVDEIVAAASNVDGVRLVATVTDDDADTLRDLAQKTVGKLGGEAAVVLGSAQGGKALLVAACSKPLTDRGVTAPALLEHAAAVIGGGAGGKPGLGFAGGKLAEGVVPAVESIAARLEELLDA
ncbi:MAG TPA: alanine--tRNA ligase [Actinomycetota bacterium]|nr:alanine--tRNA ligase [Actinomycetota bacterium]